MSETHRRRLIVVGVVENSARHWLLCRMPRHRGVLPGEWALPGGGVEQGERLGAALEREMREELGIAVKNASAVTFKDAIRDKLHADGHSETLHMVFLIYHCRIASGEVRLNDEFEAYRWVDPDALDVLSLDEMTRDTLLTVRAAIRHTAPWLDTPRDTAPASSP